MALVLLLLCRLNDCVSFSVALSPLELAPPKRREREGQILILNSIVEEPV